MWPKAGHVQTPTPARICNYRKSDDARPLRITGLSRSSQTGKFMGVLRVIYVLVLLDKLVELNSHKSSFT